MLQWHPRLIGVLTVLALGGLAVFNGLGVIPGKKFGW